MGVLALANKGNSINGSKPAATRLSELEDPLSIKVTLPIIDEILQIKNEVSTEPSTAIPK